MKHMKHLLTTMAVLLYSLVASAQTKVEIDGIWYNLITKVKQAEVTFKGDDPFLDNDYSGSITIPATVTYDGVAYSVTSIGEEAFSGCINLTAITIPEGVTSIGSSVFCKCSSLTAINIPEGVTSIGYSVFQGCSSLTAITLPESLTSIERYAFAYCSNLTAINIPEGVTSIGNRAFYDCSSLTAINIPEGVTSIGSSVFQGCSSLTAINIPEGVTSIGSHAFQGCSSLTAINIPEGVTSIGAAAFSSCSNLTAINIPEGVTSIESSAFVDCSSLAAITLPEGVTSIGSGAFAHCSSLTTVVLPKSVKSIGWKAFANCGELTDVYCYAESVPSTEADAFDGSYPDYATLHVPTSAIESYKAKAPWSSFGTIVSLSPSTAKVEIGDIWYNLDAETNEAEVIYRGDNYYDNKYSGSITIPATVNYNGVAYSVTSIGENAFYQCKDLTAITLPEGLASIKSEAFYECEGLTAITLPASVTNIGEGAFTGCTSLAAITIPASVTSIEASAFAGCIGLATITFAEKSQLTTIETEVFAGCSSLTAITLPEGVTSIRGLAFYYCENLTTVNLPEGLTEIEEGAFHACTSLATITLPEGVKIIGDYVFSYCISLTTIVLPQSVESIGSTAFAGCAELTDVYCHAESVPTTEADAFEESYPGKATLHVPASAINDYKATAPWSSFGTILPLDGDQPAEEGWSEWNHLGTAVTASGKESMIATFQYWGTESVVAWDEPITIDQRTNVADPTKHQLRLNDIFNGKEIILDYDSSTGKISAEQQSTGYATNKELMVEQSGWSDFYDEFMFALDYTTGSYNPLTGTIDLSKAFFHVSDPSVQMFYFNLGFTLQIEGVTPPTFTYAWDRTYVGRGECEATLTVTFEEPIVKYRKLVIAPGETVYVYQLEELYKANPETDLEYEDTDQPTTTITCDQIGIYRVLLIPLGADGTAVMDYMLARMVSYAEPDYDSYTWNYIGESTVIEAMGSNLIPNEEAWEEVDGIWVNKYPWTVEVEGVQTYRRADNPNIIGLRNLYGENHPYSSIFQFIDQSQDWWVYIDVTNPEDVRLLTTPVGATSSNDGYASFISHYAEANAAATYTDGVITFPFFSVLLGNIVNQEQVAEFDFKVILPEEETMPMEAITVNQYGSGTYCSQHALDFSAVEGLKAYAATGYNKKTKVVTLTRVMTTQPGEGLFIKGEPGTYKVPVIEEANDNSLNMLVGALTETSVNAYSADGLYANYKYTIKEGDSQPLFYQFADGSTLGAGKAYLQIPVAWLPQTSETKSISLRFEEGEGTTDIENSQFTIDNSQLTYDLFGRRVDNPVKGGIYIVGGRKVVY